MVLENSEWYFGGMKTHRGRRKLDYPCEISRGFSENGAILTFSEGKHGKNSGNLRKLVYSFTQIFENMEKF